MTASANSAVVGISEWIRRVPDSFRNPFRPGGARIGTRLTACFVAIVLSMMAADVVAVWQFSRTLAPAGRLNEADRTSLAVVRVHLDVDTFRDSVAALASTQDIRQFTNEAATLRQKFVEDVAQSQQLLVSSRDTGQDPVIRSALETLRVTLPSQLDTTAELASAGDWAAVSLRVADQVQALIDLSSSLVEKVDREVSQERAEAIGSAQRARRQLLTILPVAALLPLLVAVALGWYATRSITEPLFELDAGARALAQGDFQYQVAIQGEDELAQLGRVFNDTARRLAALYETLRSNEAHLRLTIDTIPAYVWSALPDGSLDFINRRWLEFSGMSLDEGLGWGWEAAVHPDDLARFVEEWRTAVTSGKAMESEARVRGADGQYRWLLIRNVPLWDEAGKIVKWYGTSTDIDDRKRAEEAVCRSNRELRAISNCNQTLLRATDEQSLLDEICRIVCEEAGYRMAWVAYAEHDEAKRVRPVAWAGTEEGYLATAGITWADTERGWGPTGTAIRSGRSCFVQDFAADPRVLPWRESALQRGFRCTIALPLKDEHGNAFGSLTIYSAQPNAFRPEEIRLLEELAADLAFGIVTLRSRAARKQAEEALSESEQRFRTFVDHAADALFIYDFEQGTIVDANRQACESLGYTRQELIGMTPLAFDRNVDRVATESIAEWTTAGETVIDRHWHLRKDRTLFPVEVHTSQYWYEGRRFMLKLARDISDRLRAEEERAYLASIVESSEDAIIGTSIEGIIQSWNRGAERLYGYTAQEAIGQPITLLILPDRAQEFVSADRLKQGEATKELETVRVGKDGRRIDVSVTVSLMKNAAGRVFGAATIARDNTERKCAEEALRRSEAYLADGQRLTHTGSFAWSAVTRRTTYWSEEQFRIFGLHPQEGVPTTETFWQRIHPEDLDRTRELLFTAAERSMEYEHDHRIVLPDGTVKHIHAIGHPVLDENGRLAGYVGTAVDITERKRAEEERERLRQLEADLAHMNRVSMMGELAASIAHEVNQPLSGIVSNGSACLRFLAGDAFNVEEAREAARDIVRDGKRAGEIIARIRALTKRAATPRERLDLNESIPEVLALVGAEAKRKGVGIRTQFADDLSLVSADRVQLQQVLLNLIMNAMEAMSSVDERPRDLAITTRNIDTNQVQVTVEDSGVGLDPNTIARIFDPFYTTKPGGMGMGLSISRSILQAHGGRLWAAVNNGPGTTFSFTLPTCHEEEPKLPSMSEVPRPWSQT